MKERIHQEIERLESMRDAILIRYLDALVDFTPDEGSMTAIGCVQILHDLDKHLSNLHWEIKRIEHAPAEVAHV